MKLLPLLPNTKSKISPTILLPVLNIYCLKFEATPIFCFWKKQIDSKNPIRLYPYSNLSHLTAHHQDQKTIKTSKDSFFNTLKYCKVKYIISFLLLVIYILSTKTTSGLGYSKYLAIHVYLRTLCIIFVRIFEILALEKNLVNTIKCSP